MEGAEAGVHAGSVREIVGAGGMFAEWFPETENRVTAEDLDDAAAMEFEQAGAAVGAGEEGAEELHGRKGLKGGAGVSIRRPQRTAWAGEAGVGVGARGRNQEAPVRRRPTMTPWMMSSVAGRRSG